MSPDFNSRPTVGYAAFRLRYRALLLDAGICLAFFLIVGIAAGVVFERHPFGRAAAVVVILSAILFYEPFMVSQYGGTFGHRAQNIRVVRAVNGQNLTLPRAMVRLLVKQGFGLLSLAFMFVTKRAQSLHDLAVGSEVRIRHPEAAARTDYFVPEPTPAANELPSLARRLIVIGLYNVVLFLLMLIMFVLSVTALCIEQNICTSSEELAESFISLGWLVMVVTSVGLGLKGRLPGARRLRSSRITQPL